MINQNLFQGQLFAFPTNRSKYHFIELRNGFLIDSLDRNQVFVEHCETHFLVWSGVDHPDRVGLVQFQDLLKHIAWGLMQDWSPPDNGSKPWPGIKSWAVAKTRRAIGRRVHQQWQRLLESTDKTILAVQKRIFSATFGAAPISFDKRFYEEQYLVQDVIRFRAAAIAVREVVPLHRQALKLNSSGCLNCEPCLEQFSFNEFDSRGLSLGLLKSWPDLFASGKAYPVLRRTLTNLPGGVPGSLLVNLPRMRLRRTFYKRLELILALLAFDHKQTNEKVFHFATEGSIKKAMKIMSRASGVKLQTRRLRHIDVFISQLAEYPEVHRGNIVGLAKKTVRFFRDRVEGQVKKIMQSSDELRQVTLPPIALPQQKEIRFLNSADELLVEGVQMGHCVGTLVPDAMSGKSYFFHVLRNREHATVQVDEFGRVKQSRGPMNEVNATCKWGARVLGQWGKGFGSAIERSKASPQYKVDPVYEAVPF